MLRAGVVHHQIDDHVNSPLVCLVQETLEVGVGAVVFRDGLVIGGVVAVIARRFKDGHQPDRVDAEVGVGGGVAIIEVVQSGDQTLEVPDAIDARIGEAADEDLVEHRAARPLVVPLCHRGGERRPDRADASIHSRCRMTREQEQGESDRRKQASGSHQSILLRTADLCRGDGWSISSVRTFRNAVAGSTSRRAFGTRATQSQQGSDR